MESEIKDMVELMDYAALASGGDLLVEFARTGVEKRFQRIHIGSGYGASKKHMTTAVFIEPGDPDQYSLVVEVREYDYSDALKLRRCVLDQFVGGEAANDALARVKGILCRDAKEANADSIGVEEDNLALQRKGGLSNIVRDVAHVVLVSAFGFGAIGLGLGGWALFAKF